MKLILDCVPFQIIIVYLHIWIPACPLYYYWGSPINCVHASFLIMLEFEFVKMFVFSHVHHIVFYWKITLCTNSCHISLGGGPQECYTEAHTCITIFYKYEINRQTQTEILFLWQEFKFRANLTISSIFYHSLTE